MDDDNVEEIARAVAKATFENVIDIDDRSTIEDSYVLTVMDLPWRTPKPNFRGADNYEIMDFYQGENSPLHKGRQTPEGSGISSISNDRKSFKNQDVFLVRLKTATVLYRLEDEDPSQMNKPKRWFTVEKYHPDDPVIRKLAADKEKNSMTRPRLLYVPEGTVLWLGRCASYEKAFVDDKYPSFVGGAWQVLLPEELVKPLHKLTKEVLKAMPLDQREARNRGMVTLASTSNDEDEDEDELDEDQKAARKKRKPAMWEVFKQDKPNKDILDKSDWLKTMKNVLGNQKRLKWPAKCTIEISTLSQKFKSHYEKTARQQIETRTDAIMNAHCFTFGPVDVNSDTFRAKLPSNIQLALRTNSHGWDAAKVNWNRSYRATVRHPFGTFDYACVIKHPYLKITHGGRGYCIGG